MYIYFFIFILLFTCFVFPQINKPYKFNDLGYWLIFILLFLFAGFRAKGVDNDMNSYINSIKEGWGVAEFTFYIISDFCYGKLGSIRLIFLIYCFLSLVLVFKSYKKLSNSPYISILIYYSFFYVVHPLNQIRAGVATGFALFAIYYWYNKPSNIKKTLLYLLLAISFHYSAIIFIPIVFIIKNTYRNIKFYLLLIPLAYCLYFFKLTPLNLLSYINFDYIVTKVILYQKFGKDVVQEVNVFSILIMIKLFFIFILYNYRNILSKSNKYYYFYLKSYIVGLFFLIILYDMPGMAFRTAELFWIIEPFIITSIFSKLKPTKMSYFFLFILCGYWVFLNYYQSGFINSYKFSITL